MPVAGPVGPARHRPCGQGGRPIDTSGPPRPRGRPTTRQLMVRESSRVAVFWVDGFVLVFFVFLSTTVTLKL